MSKSERRSALKAAYNAACTMQIGALKRWQQLLKPPKTISKCGLCGVTVRTINPHRPRCQMHDPTRLSMRKLLKCRT